MHRIGTLPATCATTPPTTLPEKDWLIEVALSGHDEVSDGKVLVQADEAGDELEPRDDLGSERGEPSGEAARGAGPGKRGDVHTEIGPIAVRETGESSGQRLDLFGRGALLWGKDPCRVEEPGRHVAGGDELDASERFA